MDDIDLTHEFTLTATLGPPREVGRTPEGRLGVYPVLGGHVMGSRVSGEVLPGGADRLRMRDGWGRLDVRLEVRTDSGGTLAISYRGHVELVPALVAGEPTQFADHYYRCTFELASGEEDLAWVNRTAFVGRGRATADGVEYEVFAVR